MFTRICLLFCILISISACETAQQTEENRSYSYPKVSLNVTSQDAKLKIPKPDKGASSDVVNVAILFADNLITFLESLGDQYESNLGLAVQSGFITNGQARATIKRIKSIERFLFSKLRRYSKRLSERSSVSLKEANSQLRRVLRYKRVRNFKFFLSPFKPPVKRIPKAKKKKQLKNIRYILGQVVPYSGLAVSFIDNLASQLSTGATAEQLEMIEELRTSLRKAFTGDIAAINGLILIVNKRRFKNANRQKIDPASFAGTYNGTCTNLTAGRVANVSIQVDYDPSTGLITVSYVRPDSIWGSGGDTMFSEVFGSNGLTFAENSSIFGAIAGEMSSKGYITGSIIADTISEIDQIIVRGAALTKENKILLDARALFPEYDQGKQSHIVIELDK